MEKKKVLFVGIDPSLLDLSKAPVNATEIRERGMAALKRLEQNGFEVSQCAVDLGETAAEALERQLEVTQFDAIMIGAGIRVLPQHTYLFEQLINVIHRKAPLSKLCFNTEPGDSDVAVLRWSKP